MTRRGLLAELLDGVAEDIMMFSTMVLPERTRASLTDAEERFCRNELRKLAGKLRGRALRLGGGDRLSRRVIHSCSGVAAVWCPCCGACTCPELPDGTRLLDEDGTGACPLHGRGSRHGASEDSR